MVIDAHEELRSRGQAEPRLPSAPTGDMAAAMAALEATAAAALGAKGEKEEQRRRLEAAIELCAGGGSPSLEELDAVFFGNPKGLRGECAKALRAATARAAEAGAGGLAYDHIGELLGLFDRHFGTVKAARSGLDFEDLQLEAVRLLTGTEVGETYRGQFAQLMVDEFQDTNRLQLSLIEALRGPETEVFLVGDEFQSIYGFRHADLEVFRGKREEFRDSGKAKVLPLSGNFRSRPEIVAAANAIGDSMLDDFNPLSVGVAPEEDTPPGGGPAVELLLTDRNGWDAEGIELDLPVDDRTPMQSVAEARFLAARLRELTEGGRRARGRRRAAAGLHPRRRLRGGIRARRAAALRARRPRLLVTAAGRGRALPALGDRQPARRRAAARRTGLAGMRRASRHPLDPAPRRWAHEQPLAGARARRRRLGAGARGARVAGADSARGPRAADPLPLQGRGAARGGAAALARGADRAGGLRHRL